MVAVHSMTADGIREAMKDRLDGDGRFELTDMTEVSILAMFVLQKLGKASTTEIHVKAQDIGAVINEHLLEQAVEALQAKDLVSYARGRKATAAGENIKQWKVRKAVWSSPPEMAQITELLPALVATKEAQDLIKTLNDSEEEGDGTSKGRRKLGYDNYADVRVTFITLDTFLGSQPASPLLDDLCKRFPHGGVDAALRFWRDELDGALLIPSDVIRGWLRTGLRSKRPRGFAETVVSYIGCHPAKIQPSKPLIQAAFPVIDRMTGQGKGLSSHEALQAGETFSINFRIPTRGFMEPLEFVRWLASYAPCPIRGLSPARGSRLGKLAVTGHEVLTNGEAKDDLSALRVARDLLPESARAYYDVLLG